MHSLLDMSVQEGMAVSGLISDRSFELNKTCQSSV